MPTIAGMLDTIEDDYEISALTQNASATTFQQQVKQDYGNVLRLTPEERLDELAKRSKSRMHHSQQDHKQQKEDCRHRHNMPTTVAEESKQDDASNAPSTSGTVRTAFTLDDLAEISLIWANQFKQPQNLKPVPGTPC